MRMRHSSAGPQCSGAAAGSLLGSCLLGLVVRSSLRYMALANMSTWGPATGGARGALPLPADRSADQGWPA